MRFWIHIQTMSQTKHKFWYRFFCILLWIDDPYPPASQTAFPVLLFNFGSLVFKLKSFFGDVWEYRNFFCPPPPLPVLSNSSYGTLGPQNNSSHTSTWSSYSNSVSGVSIFHRALGAKTSFIIDSWSCSALFWISSPVRYTAPVALAWTSLSLKSFFNPFFERPNSLRTSCYYTTFSQLIWASLYAKGDGGQGSKLSKSPPLVVMAVLAQMDHPPWKHLDLR